MDNIADAVKVIRLYLESLRENDCTSLLVHPRVPVTQANFLSTLPNLMIFAIFLVLY